MEIQHSKKHAMINRQVYLLTILIMIRELVLCKYSVWMVWIFIRTNHISGNVCRCIKRERRSLTPRTLIDIIKICELLMIDDHDLLDRYTRYDWNWILMDLF